MSYFGNFFDGRGTSAASLFRVLPFAVVSILGFGSVVIDVYLICRYWHTAPAYVAPILSILIGVQLIYQWFRVLLCRAKMRQFYSKGGDEGSPLDSAIRVADRGMIDMLFFFYGTTIVALVLIGFLLSRLDGL